MRVQDPVEGSRIFDRVRRWLPSRELIGPPECPILNRWTLFPWGSHGHSDRNLKLMLHHFLPSRDDRDVHDHPRSFLTIVLRGGYDDLIPCPTCSGSLRTDDSELLRSGAFARAEAWMPCPICWDGKREGPQGFVVGDRMRPGMVRYRPAEHRHRTRVGPKGCWTLVVMGPLARAWGFWREGQFWKWAEYERRFGFGMRCEDVDVAYDEHSSRSTPR